MPFKEIKGQEKAVAGLTQAILQGRTAHAYLFSGPSGVGKKKAALALAKALNCLELKILSPQGNSLKIEQIRQLQKEIHLRPSTGEKKVYILEDAEKMTEEAANSLLKILEEPPGYAIMILLTAYPYSLLATIRSRCQPIVFQPLGEKVIEEVLNSSLSEQRDKNHILARLAQGSLAQAFCLAQEEKLEEKRKFIWSLIQELWSGRKEIFMQAAERLDKDGREKIQEALALLLSCYRDILLWQQTKQGDLLINLDREEEINALSSLLSSRELGQIIKEIEDTRRLIMKNINAKLALEVLFLQLSKRGEEKKCI